MDWRLTLDKFTAEQIDYLYSQYKTDPDGTADQFWSAVSAYAGWSCFSVPEYLREDLVSDIVVAAMTRIDSINVKVSFVKWLNGLIYNLRAERFRVEKYQRVEFPFSQLASEHEDGTFEEYQPTDDTCPSDASDLLTDEDRAKSAKAKLDALRASFKQPADLRLFDLLRDGATLEQASLTLGQSYAATQRRFARWKNKVGQKVSDEPQFRYVTSYKGKRAA